MVVSRAVAGVLQAELGLQRPRIGSLASVSLRMCSSREVITVGGAEREMSMSVVCCSWLRQG